MTETTNEVPLHVEELINETLYPMADIRKGLTRIFEQFNLGLEEGSFWYTLLVFGVVLGVAVLLELLLRLLFVRTAPKLLQKLPVFAEGTGKESRKIISKVIRIISVSLFSGLLPLVWPTPTLWYNVLSTLCSVWVILLIVQIIANIFDAIRGYMLESEKYRNSPFINLFQVFKAIAYFVATLFVISVVFSLNMTTIGASLTALSAVLMLVFKDSILGFVASIQLSNNDMVRVGDWITMNKYGVDGDVIDISLATIKVKNFDKTVSTIPPYSMITESFQNWRPMQEDGGRRVKRSIHIDMQSIKYADEALLTKLKNSRELHDYIDTAVEEINKDNAERGIADSYSKRGLTNVGIFRRYIEEYLKGHPRVHKTFTCMVRQQQPTELGLPLELYFFTDTTVWLEYESIQSDIFDHLLAVIPVFELKVFQNINGNNLSIYTPAEKVTVDM